MYALGAFFDYNGTSSMGGKVNEEKWILVYIFIWAIHVISSYVDSCWRNTVFEHERMDCLSGFMAGDGCCFKRIKKIHHHAGILVKVIINEIP